MIITISGSVGTGKTTVADELSRLMNCGVIHISSIIDDIKSKFRDEHLDTYVVDEKEVESCVLSLLNNMNKTCVIIEGHFIGEIDVPSDISFVLRTHPDELRRRLSDRGYSNEKIYENILTEILDYSVIKNESMYGEVYEIDTTNRSPKEVAGEIVSIIKSRGKKSKRTYDWSGLIHKYVGVGDKFKPSHVKSKTYKLFNMLLDEYGEQHWWPAKTRYEVVVGAVLTQNTSWKNVEKAILNLKRHNVLSPKAILSLPIDELKELIRPAGFFNQKAERLINITKLYIDIAERFNEISLYTLRNMLLSVKGIGKETADSILLYAFDKPIFVVDTYTKRFCSHFNLFYGEDYEEYRAFFEATLPRDVWLFKEYHALIVEWGKKNKRRKIKKDKKR